LAIRTVITRGYGNGTYLGTIALVVPRGYISGAAVVEEAVDERGAWYPVWKAGRRK